MTGQTREQQKVYQVTGKTIEQKRDTRAKKNKRTARGISKARKTREKQEVHQETGKTRE